LNATVQLLYNIPELRTFFSKSDADFTALIETLREKPVKVGSGCETQDKVIQSLKLTKKIFDTMNAWAPGTPAVNMTSVVGETKPVYIEIIKLIQLAKDPKGVDAPFRPDKQADADEFYKRFVEGLLLCTDLPEIVDLKSKFQLRFSSLFECEDRTIGRNGVVTSLVDNEYTIAPQIAKVDKAGNFVFDTKITTLQKAVDKLQSPEALSEGENNLEICGKDGGKGIAVSKKIEITPTESSKYLTVLLNRKSPKDIKYNENILFTNTITINKILTVAGISYQIKGAICHLGSANGGHYIYYVYKNGEPITRISDDDISNRVSTVEIDTRARILLYEKVVGGGSRKRTTRKQKKSSKRKTRKH
jgi:hypothetical protein